jgi:hypothetical protein
MKNLGKLSLIAGALAIGAVLATTAFAAGRPSSVPGWGFGDTQNVHTGPPGTSVFPRSK